MSDQVSLEHNSFRGVLLGGLLVLFASFLSDYLATVRDVKNLSRVIKAEITLNNKTDELLKQIKDVKSALDGSKIHTKNWHKSTEKMFYEDMSSLFGKLDGTSASKLIRYAYTTHSINTILLVYSEEKRDHLNNNGVKNQFDYARWSTALQSAIDNLEENKKLGQEIISDMENVHFFTPLKFW